MESTVITSDDLPELGELLVEMAGQWEVLLKAIGLSAAEVDIIRLKHPEDTKLCLVDGLEQWVVSSGSPTFGKLLSALRGKVPPNFPLSDRIEEFAKKKAKAPADLSKSVSQSPTPASPGNPSPVMMEAATLTHRQTASSTEPAMVAMKPKVLPPPSSPTTSELAITKAKTGFPLLPTAALSKHQLTALMGRLLRQYEAIQDQFSDMVYDMIDSLKRRVDLSVLIYFLAQRRVLQYREGCHTNYASIVHNAKSMNEIFIYCCSLYSFIRYDLITALVQEFGTDDNKQRLAEYEENLSEYCKRRVYECPVDAFGSRREDEILLVAKLKDELEGFTLKAVIQFMSKLCDILNLPDDSLRFIEPKEGCIELHFGLLSLFESGIHPLSSRQRERLQGEGVMELRGGRHRYNLLEEGVATSERGSTAEHCSGD